MSHDSRSLFNYALSSLFSRRCGKSDWRRLRATRQDRQDGGGNNQPSERGEISFHGRLLCPGRVLKGIGFHRSFHRKCPVVARSGLRFDALGETFSTKPVFRRVALTLPAWLH